ncbi:hypothetical protein M9H77_17375 [Catharanthus roseus]|uniref:Uncharacterized protein n=1 Tax=Catharanthus roseus TaxID=4058 RepID=A0ACC0B4N3_CATRO|nr:hypothetical protein M9H77_17375 [Catharanthus roseus]
MITYNGCVIANERLNQPNNLVYRRGEDVEENVAELGVEMKEVLAHVHSDPIVPDVLTRQHEHMFGLIWSGDRETSITDLYYKVKKEPLEDWILRDFTGSETDDDFISMSISQLVANDLEILVSKRHPRSTSIIQTNCTYKGAWDAPYNLTFHPPNMNNERGRKQGTRFQEEMDYRNPDSPLRSGRCRMSGHNKKIIKTPLQAMYKFPLKYPTNVFFWYQKVKLFAHKVSIRLPNVQVKNINNGDSETLQTGGQALDKRNYTNSFIKHITFILERYIFS